MTPRRRLVTLSASLALHGGLLLAVLLAVSGETEPGALFIDLTEDVRSEATGGDAGQPAAAPAGPRGARDRKSTRLNSSHGYISYAVFCLKKKKKKESK